MNLRFHRRLAHRHRGLTLMEAVVALGVIAVAVPLILSATAVSARTRVNAETDTRSAWLARTVQRELTDAWRDLPSTMFTPKPTFPAIGSIEAPEVLLFDADGKFLTRGNSNDYIIGTRNDKAVYVVSLYAQKQNPANFTVNADSLSLVQITVGHNARAPVGKRNTHSYSILIPRQTSP
jgi:type II secretory pathway pseudopilin PulG